MKKPTKDLKPHPLNSEIYQDEADEELVESVRANGILQPVLIDRSDRVISGHRRLDAARKAGIEKIPVTLFFSNEEVEIMTALVEANRQRTKSNEQSAREAACLFRLEREKAEARRAAAPTKDKDPAKSPGDSGDARDVAAKKLGLGAKKVEQAAAVVELIDELKKQGRDSEAKLIISELNRYSVNRAYKVALERGLLARAGQQSLADDLDYILVQDWKKMSPDSKKSFLGKPWKKSKFIRQTSDGIEWAEWSWNPIVGCLHGCEYCYARDIAAQRYRQRFAPAFFPGRLKAPAATARPKGFDASKNVFTCSMSDLFGEWVPTDLIQHVLDAACAAPDWNFLFLTKNPRRLCDFQFPENAWVGTTVDCQERVQVAEEAFEKVKAHIKWVSCEPMRERLTFSRLDLFDWVVIGGATKSTRTSEFRPPREWIFHLWQQAKEATCKIWEKPNLLERNREFPRDPQMRRMLRIRS